MTKDVAAVVVTYNRKALLRQCVASLLGQTWADMDIWVIDNASTDGTGAMLAPLIGNGRVHYQNTGGNLGGAGGFEYGLRVAAQQGYDYVWIMDDDAIPEPTALEALMRAAGEMGDFGYLSGKVLWTDGSICRMNVQRDLKLRNISDFTPQRIPSGAATFVSLLVPVRVIREVGLPIGDFFIWADDLEYTRRISLRHPCYVITDSVTVHRCETNNGGNIATDRPERIPRYRFAYRNEVYVYRREGLRGAARLMLRTPLHVLRVLVKAEGRKAERIRVIFGGTLKGLSFRPNVKYPE
ncbi:MAG: glycosyltransferase family 2 protein [Clostridia bacterium]|nr:glycosyltransferase family 2 protein [Clostridia bacterium]